ncbi:imelysin family protein [uncultured Thioclava sp.]|uniref:imelysin family protein n=1 Tax=uncultured Thioclava sp. TaxID=473858 RepID=UPI0025FBA2B6|nr:imelysin family protein [uncultured Thioclava sp.]
MTRLAVLSVLFAALIPLAGAAQDTQAAYEAIYDDILLADSEATVQSCHAMVGTLETVSTQQAREDAFTALAIGWGRVQATYILGGYDMDAMDYPLLIDMFHNGKEDLHASLERAIKSDSSPQKALYKNAYRSITALDDILFSGPWSQRRQALAQEISGSLCKRFETVHQGYLDHRDDFLANPNEALGLLMNAQIQSLYKTRDWRISEVAGLTKKTLGQMHPENRQYRWGKASWPVIDAILDTHWRLLATETAPNLSSIAEARDAGAGLASVQDMLGEAIEAYKAVPEDKAFAPREAVPIINALQRAQNAYYNSLALLVGVTLGLVDADGD